MEGQVCYFEFLMETCLIMYELYLSYLFHLS
jgi:hypothetical protein